MASAKDHTNSARSLCWDELASTGSVELQAIEKKHSKRSTLSQRSANVAPKAEAEAEALPTVETAQAPDTSPREKLKAPKKRKPTLAQKPPTFEDLHEYAKSLEYSDDTLRDFVDYWTAQGWRRKGGPCRDAEATLRSNKRMKINGGWWKPRGAAAGREVAAPVPSARAFSSP